MATKIDPPVVATGVDAAAVVAAIEGLAKIQTAQTAAILAMQTALVAATNTIQVVVAGLRADCQAVYTLIRTLIPR